MQKSPPRHPSESGPERAGEAIASGDELEAAATPQDSAHTDNESDPYDDLWDPDMDTRPERIRKTKVRARTDSRTKGGPPPRGKRRDGV